MHLRSIVASTLALSLAATAIAQGPDLTFHWNWRNAATGDQSPLVPGQSAQVWLDVSFSPGPGSTFLLKGQSHTILGLDAIGFDLIATSVNGMWILSGSGFMGTAQPNGPLTNFNATSFGRRSDLIAGAFPAWAAGPVGASVMSQTSGFTLGSIAHASAGQHHTAGLLPSDFNPIIEIWRGQFTPHDYARSQVFHARKALAAPGTGASLWIYPTGTNPLETMEVYHLPPASIDFGSLTIFYPGFSCYANCDGSQTPPILNVDDFICFINRFAEGDPYANCDNSLTDPILNIDDFICFINAYAQAVFCD